MKTIILILIILALSVLWPTVLSLGACPEDPNDNGICDTISVEAYSPDLHFTGAGQLVRVTISITHDITGPVDSLAAMMIPLCYTHTNPAKYCSLSSYWNKTVVSGTSLPRSIFRDIEAIRNHFLHLYGFDPYYDCTLDISTSDQHFWFSYLPSSTNVSRWGTSSHELVLTATFRVEDTMTVCIDSCFWSLSNRLHFSRADAETYIPRHNLPYCFQISSSFTGDANGDGTIDVSDVVFVINYLFRSGPVPSPLQIGDANCDQTVDVSDIVFLINYLFRSGPPPSC
jgi:hypothetical protein